MSSTYVMSDLHGLYDRYLKMLEKIHFRPEDRLYILGDVIDRGPDGIRLLQDFMQRDNVTLLLGNHEDMMLEVVTLEEMQGEVFDRKMYHWSKNGGDVTAHAFFHGLNYKEQMKLIAYLEDCPLMLPNVEAGGRRYYLVHACPDVSGMTGKEEIVTRNILAEWPPEKAAQLKKILLWKRIQDTEEIPEDCCVVFGHTPTILFQDNVPMTFWHGDRKINIDSGCAYLAKGRTEGQMGCLRLEDGEEFYL